MMFWIIQVTVMSAIFIFLIHHLIQYFKETLTIPKLKDLVDRPKEQYEKINMIIHSSDGSNNMSSGSGTSYSLDELLPSQTSTSNNNDSLDGKIDGLSMKNTLKEYMKSQIQDSISNINISNETSMNMSISDMSNIDTSSMQIGATFI
jgi:hypothetical protein